MHPITHFLGGWVLADSAGLKGRDRAMVTWASVVPDVDGLGALIDWANLALGCDRTVGQMAGPKY